MYSEILLNLFYQWMLKHETSCYSFSNINNNYSLNHVLGLSKKYPLLTGNRNKAIRYYYSPSRQLNLSILNLASHTLHLKIIHETPEIQARKVKIYSGPETRGFETGPSHHDLYHRYFPKHLFEL